MHKYIYDVLNRDLDQRRRVVESVLTAEEARRFADTGYLLLEQALDPALLESLRAATEDLRLAKFGRSLDSTYRSASFSGQYVREPQFFDRRFWPLLEPRPIVGTVRHLLGPRIVMRSCSIRITHPGTNAGTRWHGDQRSMVVPRPVLFTEPNVVTVLMYLDDADYASGPTYLLPGSHREALIPPEDRAFDDLDGQVVLTPSAGTIVLLHSALWHRGGPNTADGHLRHIVIQQFAPAWAKRSEFEERPDTTLEDELVGMARSAGDEPMLELLGHGGYM